MKKLLVLISAIFALTASAALAKTEGSSVGVSFLSSQVSHQNSNYKGQHFEGDNQRSVSVNYKHAIPVVNSFYVAPGLAYDRIGTSTETTSNYAADKVNLNNRFNARLDLGYDVNETLAVYAVAGYSALGYEVYNNNNNSTSEKKNGYAVAPLFGVGFKTEICKNLDLALEYNQQNAVLQTSTSTQKVKSEIRTVSIGLAYNF